MRVSELHEDYSGPNPDGWYSDPNTRIHEAEWILEASARFLPPDPEHGNAAGDDNSTGWGGKPVDYVQGHGIVDAKRAVGIALTLERLRNMCDDPSRITVWDAMKAYDTQGVVSTMSISSAGAEVAWSGEFSRYNDQEMNPLSLVNQTKYVEVPDGATKATVTMTYAGLDMTEFQAGDLSFTIDTNGDGNPDVESSLSFLDGGVDMEIVSTSGGELWTFDIVGRGVKIPRPFQGVNYVEMRIEYEISVSFELSGNGTNPVRPLNAVFSPVFPGSSMEEGTTIDVYSYNLRGLKLPGEEEQTPEPEEGMPWGIIAALLALFAAVGIGYLMWKRKKPKKEG
jgi:hypothetical protein